ncbi:MAG: signal recognition particle-docking protein FtsY [Actinobacteria bacterium]|nr:MAG: signal recognition particle-docking protein FtsY [Actinomycetota bacterium]TMM24958.1 MAG: signal recognition particle-docking protein FtsY [Actinomycetota bacterium]
MWFVLVFALLAVLLVIAGTMRIVRRRRAGLGHGRVFPAALEHPAPQRHGEAPPEASPSGGAFRGGGLGSTLKGLFHGGATEATWHELEELLLKADVGPKAASDMVHRVRADHPTGGDVIDTVRTEILSILGPDRPLTLDGRLSVILVVGVNGSGKTTTIGKLAKRLVSEGRIVSVAAADTFRAAAGEQLAIWARVAGAQLIAQDRGADPGAVAFDAVKASEARGVDVLIVDTAGRLHTKQPLMDELSKIARVIEKAGAAVVETFLVLDAQTGQNGIAQARAFTDAVTITGVVLTKTDGSAKGGIVLAVREELGVPVRFVGVGERPNDLRPFDAGVFADRLLSSG